MIYLLVEGITDIAFIKYICLKNGITTNFNDFEKQNPIYKQVETYKYNNIFLINLTSDSKLQYALENIVSPQEKKIKKIGIVQDADNDFEKSKAYIEEALTKSKINKEKVEYFLTPNNKDEGDLETLLLSTLKDNNIINCFNPYEKCLIEHEDIHEKALNKGKVYAYTMYSQKGKNLYKPQDSFINKDTGTDTKLWDLSKKEFAPFIEFILKIFNK